VQVEHNLEIQMLVGNLAAINDVQGSVALWLHGSMIIDSCLSPRAMVDELTVTRSRWIQWGGEWKFLGAFDRVASCWEACNLYVIFSIICNLTAGPDKARYESPLNSRSSNTKEYHS
jgi:hypothetical protein